MSSRYSWSTVFMCSVALAATACGHPPRTLVNGTWVGPAVAPDGQVVELEYRVTGEGDSLALEIGSPFGQIQTGKALLEGDELTFSMFIGESFDCVLKLQEDRSYVGDCVGESGAVASLTMRPPSEHGP